MVKRFYKEVSIGLSDGDHAIFLDGRAAKTVGRHPLASASIPLAEAMADEWRAQGEMIDLVAMPLTRLQGFVLDGGEGARGEWVDTIMAFAGSDLLCYHGDDPALAQRQADQWQPILDQVGAQFGGAFAVTQGIIAVAQPDGLLRAIRGHLMAMPLSGVFAHKLMAEILGSAALALAMGTDMIDTDTAFAASQLDHDFQAERWGVDGDAAARAAMVKGELDAVFSFLTLSVPQSA